MQVILFPAYRENFRTVPPRHRREEHIEKSGRGSIEQRFSFACGHSSAQLG